MAHGHQPELDAALASAHAAGDVIRRHYQAGAVTPDAKPDGTPVTAADREANQTIVDMLTAAFPADGILAEETRDDLARLGKGRVWIVDPLDGTRDFVHRTGEFAVHVALAEAGRPVVAVVHAPIAGRTYQAVAGHGAFEVAAGEPPRRLAVSPVAELARLRIGVSRLGVNENLRRFIAQSPLGQNTVTIGASLKMMAVARGDIEVSLALTDFEREWDTCAPELIVREAGGRMTDLDGAEFLYNKPDIRHLRGILVSNGPAHDQLIVMARPYFS